MEAQLKKQFGVMRSQLNLEMTECLFDTATELLKLMKHKNGCYFQNQLEIAVSGCTGMDRADSTRQRGR